MILSANNCILVILKSLYYFTVLLMNKLFKKKIVPVTVCKLIPSPTKMMIFFATLVFLSFINFIVFSSSSIPNCFQCNASRL